MLNFEYQQNLFRRASLQLEVGGAARAGTDEQSILGTGITAVYGVNFQGKYNFLEKRRFYVSALADLELNSL